MRFLAACLVILAAGAALVVVPPVLVLLALAFATGMFVANDRRNRRG